MTPFQSPAPFPRRTLLLAAGLSAAALSGLAGCGGGAAGDASTPGPQTAPAGDIPVGGGKIYPGSQTVITQPTAGTFQAFSSICTHARCPVAEVTDSINCNCHGSRFSLVDGSVVAGPATQPLPAKAVSVSGSTVSVST
jgi:nitrite reductase/ring-hydroxylating ferredoxin subunit